MPTPLLTAAEVAEFLKLHVETVYALIAHQGLPAARVGGRWRFEEAKIREWFAVQSAPGHEGADPPSTMDCDDDTPPEEGQPCAAHTSCAANPLTLPCDVGAVMERTKLAKEGDAQR